MGFLNAVLGFLVGAVLLLVVIALVAKPLGRWLFNRMMVPLLTGRPGVNQLLQWVVLLRNTDFENMLAIMRRAETGQAFKRPYGSTRKWPGFEDLVFVPAQIKRFPRAEPDVDTKVLVGPMARKPFEIALPVMITGMAAGMALTRDAKIALAKASCMVGTLTNSGESGYLDDERQAAKLYAIQYNRGGFNNQPEQIKKVDMVEIQFGQGADASAAESSRWDSLTPWARQMLGLKTGEDAVIHTRFPGVNSGEDLRRLVEDLKNQTGGVPVAVKLCAGDVEGDVEAAVRAGADVIALDGAQGSTGSGYHVTINDFGLPTMYAVPRAHRHLQRLGVRDRVTLVASGGLRYSGDFLKAMALGADAVYTGTAALLALVQAQVVRLVPYAPPYELFIEKGRYVDRFDKDQAAEQVANFLKASADEMVQAARSLGRARLADVTAEDLSALTWETAHIAGVRLAYPHPDGERPALMDEPQGERSGERVWTQ